MLTYKERRKLGVPNDPVFGFDCEGRRIVLDDQVKVAQGNEYLKGGKQYSSCVVGRRGKVVGRLYLQPYLVYVLFEGEKDKIAYIDFHLRKM